MKLICPICGIRFEAHSRKRVYCAKKCRQVAYRQNLVRKKYSALRR